MDIQHILYKTVGDDFEKFLAPKDLLTMSKVSQTTREGDITGKFRHLMDITLQEFKIFKKNNKPGVTMDDFLSNIPLGVIYRDYVLEPGTDFNMLLDHFNCSTKTRECVAVELGDFPDELEWSEAIFQASIRGREDMVETLYGESCREYRKYGVSYTYYPGSNKLIDLFVKNERDFITEIGYCNEDKPCHYMFNLRNESNDKTDFLSLVTCFQEQYVLERLYKEYDEKIPDIYKDILRDPSLKYNIDRLMVQDIYVKKAHQSYAKSISDFTRTR